MVTSHNKAFSFSKKEPGYEVARTTALDMHILIFSWYFGDIMRHVAEEMLLKEVIYV